MNLFVSHGYTFMKDVLEVGTIAKKRSDTDTDLCGHGRWWVVGGNIIRLQCAVHVYVLSYTEHNIFLIKYV
jgi:hypothetical protein